MSTSKILVLVSIFLALFSGVAFLLRSEKAPTGKIPLVWVSDNNPVRSVQIDAFNRENPNLHLVLDYSNQDIQKIILQCSSGVGPDIFDIYNSAELQAYVEAGIIWDVTEPAQKMGIGALGPTLWPGMRDNVRYLDKQYGYPCNNVVNLLIYNKNVFDSLGLPYPEGMLTWDQFIDLGVKIRERQTAAHPVYAATGLDWQTFFESQHGEYFTEKGELRLADSPELARAFQMHRDVLYKYRIIPSTIDLKAMSGQGGWGSSSLNQFSAGRFAMVFAGEWSLLAFSRTYQIQVRDLEAKGLKAEDIKDPLQRPIRVGCVLIPKFKELPACYGVGGRIAAINARSPHRDEALKFLQYLSGATYSRIINESGDSIPGNPQYASIGIEPGPEALARIPLHETTIKAMELGYSFRKSPFLLSTDVNRVLAQQVSRMESNPDIPVEELLRSAQNELDILVRRNLAHDPEMQKLYIERFGALPKP